MADFNVALFNLRKQRDMSSTRLGNAVGFTRQYVARVESGKSDGKKEFWLGVQKVFDIPDEDMWKIYKGEPLEECNKDTQE